MDEPEIHSATDDDVVSPTGEGSNRSQYTNAFKLKVAKEASAAANISEVACRYKITTRSSIHAWMKLLQYAYNGNQKKKVCVGGQGCPPVFLYAHEVVQWMQDMTRDDYPLKASNVILYIKEEYRD